MWINHFFLGIFGLIAGAAVSAGAFTFLIAIGVIPRMVSKSRQGNNTMWFETVMIVGGILGNIISIFEDIRLPFGSPVVAGISPGRILLCLYGLGTGIFVGCIAVALAEILNTFPIMFRRSNIKEGLSWTMLLMALGKMCGAFYFFFYNITVG